MRQDGPGLPHTMNRQGTILDKPRPQLPLDNVRPRIPTPARPITPCTLLIRYRSLPYRAVECTIPEETLEMEMARGGAILALRCKIWYRDVTLL